MSVADFSVGDRVVVKNGSLTLFGVKAGMTGTVMCVESQYYYSDPRVGVRFDMRFGRRGYTLNGRCEEGHGIFVHAASLELLDETDEYTEEFQQSFLSVIGVVV